MKKLNLFVLFLFVIICITLSYSKISNHGNITTKDKKIRNLDDTTQFDFERYKIPNFFAIATIDSIYDGYLDQPSLCKQEKLLILSEKKLKIIHFELAFKSPDKLQNFTSNTIQITSTMRDAIIKLPPSTYVFHHIVAVNQRDTMLLNPIVLRIGKRLTRLPKTKNAIQYATYQGKNNISIPKNKMSNFEIDKVKKLKISGFKLDWFFSRCYHETEYNFGNTFNAKQLGMINKSKPKDFVFLTDIMAKGKKDSMLLTPIFVKLE